jgi:orotate phosphoribosyltransferase
VEDVLCVVNRQEGGEVKLRDIDVRLSSLVTAEEILRR